jgi:proteasome lid subunit RPN8/RPN11
MATTPRAVELPRELYDEIIAHALEGWPNEVCGMIAGAPDPIRVYRIRNIDDNPQRRYNMEPEGQLRTLTEIEDRGWELYGIYHSHPSTQAYPSPTDRGLAFIPDFLEPGRRIPVWPGAVYLICSLQDRDRPHLRAFLIHEDDVEELELRVTEGATGRRAPA